MDEEGRAAVRAGHVGFVFQSFHLLPGLTALENVALPLELQGDKDALNTAAHYLTRVGLDHRTTHYPTPAIRWRTAASRCGKSLCLQADHSFCR